MNARSNWFLVVAAAALVAYVWIAGHRDGVTVVSDRGATAVFDRIDPGQVTTIEILRSNSVLRVERTNGAWTLRLPVVAPAQSASVERWLATLGRLEPRRYVDAQELVDRKDGLKSFGLEGGGAARVTLTGRSAPVILSLGNPAPLGGQFYLQRVGDSGVFTADQALLRDLPASPNEWRDRALLQVDPLACDTLELRNRAGIVFEAVRTAGGTWSLRQPLVTRADDDRLNSLLTHLHAARVAEFLSDGSPVDLAATGLQPPEAELILRRGTNEVERLVFGNLTTNTPGRRHVLRASATNLVLAEADVVGPLQLPVTAYRDRHLLALTGEPDRLERAGTNGFTLAREGTNWWVTRPRRFPADPAVVRYALDQFAGLEIAEFVNDVMTDPARYGLETPQREYLLSAGTNLLAQLQLGSFVPGRNGVLLYARETDTPGVHALPSSCLIQLPSAAGQFRDWRFAPTNVVEWAVRRAGQERQVTRDAMGWRVASGPPASLIADAVDEALHQLGRLESSRYPVADEAAFTRGAKMDEVDFEMVLRFSDATPLRQWRLRFGGRLGNNLLALGYFDDDPLPLRLEVPGDLFERIQRDLVGR